MESELFEEMANSNAGAEYTQEEPGAFRSARK